MFSLRNMDGQELLERFEQQVATDRETTANLLAYIGEIDARRMWAEQACSSMFAWCVQRFHMSEAVAGKRIRAARAARKFPVILEMVARGELHLTGVHQLAKHLTQDNHHKVLARAKHKSMRDIDKLVAELAPKADVPSRIRALPRRIDAGSAVGGGAVTGSQTANCASETSQPSHAAQAQRPPGEACNRR